MTGGGFMRFSALVTITMVFVSPLSGQRGDGQARVDVASIKASERPFPDPRGLTCALPYFERSGGRMYTPFSQTCGLIRVAYDVADYQVIGIPRDTGVGPSNLFEVDVRLTGGDAPTMEEARAVLRNLLAERFRLRAHREPRDMPIYALVTATNGPRATSCSDPKAASSYTPGRIVSCDPPLPMRRFLDFLSAETGRPVFDRTGLAVPMFELRWLPARAEPTADSPPGLFTAIQEQLGLKLEPQRGSVDTLIVDAIEPPSPN
jgi:bla regulator protein BlaR1